MRLKYAAPSYTERLDARPPYEPYVALENIESWSGRVLLQAPIETVEGGVTRFSRGDVLFGKLRPYLAKVVRPTFDGVCSTELVVLRPRKVLSEFLQYCLLAPSFIREVSSWNFGSKMPRVSPERLLNMKIDVPPIDEQGAIVRVLDEETAKINALIEKRRSLISMLDQKGAAMREQLFTCSQGQPGMTLPRIKTVLIEVNERVGSRDDVELLTVSHLTGVTPRAEKNVSMFMAESFDDYKVCQVGDVVVNTMWAWAGAAGIARTGGMVSPAYAVYRPRRGVEVNADFFDLLLRSPGFVRLMAAFSEGVWRSRLRLYPEVFLSLPLALPDISEQKRLVAEVMTELDNDERLRRLTSQSVDTTLEYRSALIAAAVTRQIDVGSAA